MQVFQPTGVEGISVSVVTVPVPLHFVRVDIGETVQITRIAVLEVGNVVAPVEVRVLVFKHGLSVVGEVNFGVVSVVLLVTMPIFIHQPFIVVREIYP